INILLVLAGVLAVLFLIYSGFLYITAGGSADKAKAARGGIINAVIGIIIIMASFFIVRFAVGIGNSAQNADGAGTGGSGTSSFPL
ncbi:MAG: Type secretion system pilin, partial [Patescibacteria group bacterium]|nr:Type secretion system pilin [Patescibacteria group bacterium]